MIARSGFVGWAVTIDKREAGRARKGETDIDREADRDRRGREGEQKE